MDSDGELLEESSSEGEGEAYIDPSGKIVCKIAEPDGSTSWSATGENVSDGWTETDSEEAE